MQTTAASESNGVNIAAAMARLMGLALVTGLVLAAIGYLPTRNLAGAPGVAAMLTGICVVLVSAAAGLAPPILSLNAPAIERQKSLMVGAAVRFLVTLLLTVSTVFSGFLPRTPLVVWIAIAYLVLLLVDTWAMVALLKRTEKASQ